MRSVAVAVGGLLTALIATAHHGGAAFDRTVVIDIEGAEATAKRIAGTWVPQPDDYRRVSAETQGSWPLTDAARAVLAADRSAVAAAQAECILPGLPHLMASSAPIVIMVDDESVVLAIDWWQAWRIVHLRSEPPAGVEPTLLGYSVGHWEHDVLVIDTSAYSANAESVGLSFPSSEAKHTVERLSVDATGRHLDYEIVIEDPTYLVSPVTFHARWDHRPEATPSNAPCDPATAQRVLED